MKKIILLIIISLTINAYDIYTHEEAYIIDKIQINKLPICPNTKSKFNKISVRLFNNIYTKKTTSIILCKTKKGKIKLIIRKKIENNKEWKHYKK